MDQEMDNTNTPTVSVLMPVYNTDPTHLRAAIESILNQTYTDFELIILNDSPDNRELEKIVKSYDDPRILYADNEMNLGIANSRNKLIDMARGKYLAIMDHDDVSYPNRFEKQVKYLNENPFVGVVSSNVEYFPKYRVTKFPRFNIDIKRCLMIENVVPHTAMMIRKSILDDTGIRYENQYTPAEDYMLVVRLAEHTMFYVFRDPLVKYRWFGNNATTFLNAKMADAVNLTRCVAHHLYPWFHETAKSSRQWVYLFDLIPIVKIKRKWNKTKATLFGLIPLYTTTSGLR